MGLTLTQRCQQVGQAYRSNPKATVRTIAQQVGIPKSSVHRHLKTIERRQQHEESVFWETTAGEAWLRLLVFGTLYYFGIKQGVGSDSLAEFLQFLCLEQQVACSATALRRLEHQLREQIYRYGQQQASQCHTDTPVGIVVGADETFFDLPVLVLVELSSGFIFTEVTAYNRQYDTWLEQAQPLLDQTRYECRSLVSDTAPALVKLALTGLGCPSIADLFQALRPLTRTIGAALAGTGLLKGDC